MFIVSLLSRDISGWIRYMYIIPSTWLPRVFLFVTALLALGGPQGVLIDLHSFSELFLAQISYANYSHVLCYEDTLRSINMLRQALITLMDIVICVYVSLF